MRPFKHRHMTKDQNEIEIDFNKLVDNISNVHGQGGTYHLLKYVFLETLKKCENYQGIDKDKFNDMFDDFIYALEEEILIQFEWHFNEHFTKQITYINKPDYL